MKVAGLPPAVVRLRKDGPCLDPPTPLHPKYLLSCFSFASGHLRNHFGRITVVIELCLRVDDTGQGSWRSIRVTLSAVVCTVCGSYSVASAQRPQKFISLTISIFIIIFFCFIHFLNVTVFLVGGGEGVGVGGNPGRRPGVRPRKRHEVKIRCNLRN